MKPLTKIILTLAMSLFFIGIIMCAIAYIAGGISLSKLDIATDYTGNSFSATADTTTISIDVDKHQLTIRQDFSVDSVSIEYAENEYDIFEIEEKNGTLSITNKQPKNWFRRQFCLLFDKDNTTYRNLTILVPVSYAGSLDVKISDADVELSDMGLLNKLNIDLDNGDLELDTVSASSAALAVNKGILTVNGGVYEKLDVSVINEAVYVSVDDLYPTLVPSATPSVTPSAEPSATPAAGSPLPLTATPTPSADPTASPSTEPSATPSATPEILPTPTATIGPAPTKTPSVLVVELAAVFNNIDCKHLKIVAHYTNIEGQLSRGSSYYAIKTNNTESSTLVTKENPTAIGSITIEQKGGATTLKTK